MDPRKIAQNYDQLADWWQSEQRCSTYGLSALQRAISLARVRNRALDVGCGSSGRFLSTLLDAGFVPDGLDISPRMIESARRLHPELEYFCEDVRTWAPTHSYDLISAWDSTFHLPLADQQPVLAKLCRALSSEGVLLFTCGAPEGEIEGTMEGMRFGYSSLGTNGFVGKLLELHCTLLHVELDQYPQDHVVILARAPR